MHTRTALAALLVASGLAVAAFAEGGHQHGHEMPGAESADTAATKAFREADAVMHRDMAITYSNDVDVDFVRGMIPHHRGAVAMARVALIHSKDPEIRRLAEEIVRAQDVEIARMEAFLKRRQGAAVR